MKQYTIKGWQIYICEQPHPEIFSTEEDAKSKATGLLQLCREAGIGEPEVRTAYVEMSFDIEKLRESLADYIEPELINSYIEGSYNDDNI